MLRTSTAAAGNESPGGPSALGADALQGRGRILIVVRWGWKAAVLALAALAALPAAPASAEEPLEVAGGALPGAQPAPELPAQRARVRRGVRGAAAQRPLPQASAQRPCAARAGRPTTTVAPASSPASASAATWPTPARSSSWPTVTARAGSSAPTRPYGDTGARPLYSDHGRTFASRVRTVAVPYPQRTAGRDARWSFDRADRRSRCATAPWAAQRR